MTQRGLATMLCLWLWVAASPAWGAGRAPYGGSLRLPIHADATTTLADPHVARTSSQRLVARLVHCRLFSVSNDGKTVPELATKLAPKDSGWSVELVRGARFHDGSEITSKDVVASLKRARALGQRSRAGFVQAIMRVREEGRYGVHIELPQGVQKGILERMLARPELSIISRGRPGKMAGCGAFRTERVSAREVILTAFSGHPVGRPRLDRLTLNLDASAGSEVERFVFDRVDISFQPSYRFPASTTQVTLGQRSTLFLTVHPAWAAGRNVEVRRSLWYVTTAKSLARYVPWEAAMARSPWPRELSPTSERRSTVKRLPRLDDIGPIVIAYPRGNSTLSELANVVRDRLAANAAQGARVRPVSDLTWAVTMGSKTALANVPLAQNPPWHIGIMIHDWAALDSAQAAWEASEVLGAFGLSPHEALLGQHKQWAANVVQQARLLPLAHLRRAIYHRGMFHLAPGTGMVRFDDSYKRP